MSVAILVSTVCFLSATVSMAAVADEADQSEEASALEEVIVSARKREESLQDVPVVISVLSSEEIARFNLSDLEALADHIPELFVGRASNGSGAQITLRGVGSGRTTMGMAQSTATVVDGVYYGYGMFLNEAMLDLENIEVIKGPQALFFGKNATAGVISFNTANPTDQFEAQARVGYEITSEDLSGEGFISGPISSNLLGRLAVRVSNMSDGYFDNKAVPTEIAFLDLATYGLTLRNQVPNSGGQPGTKAQAARGTLVWTPNERLTATFKASVSRKEDDSNAWNYVPYRCESGFTQVNPLVACEEIFHVHVPNAPDGVAGSLPDMKADGSPYNLYKSLTFTTDLSYELDDAQITSVTNYNWHRNKWGLGQNVESSTSYIAATQNTSFGAFSNETRYQTDYDTPFNFMIGFYYQNTERKHTQAGAFAALEDSSLPPDRRFVSYIKPSGTDGETLSGFGQVSWRVTPQVELAAGARYIHETADSFLVQSYVQSALRGLFLQDAPITADQKFTKWTPEATIAFYPSENLTLFAGYRSAYKSGGFAVSSLIVASAVPEDISFEPETADGFEVGFKSTLLDNQFRFNANLYSFKYKNLQVDFFNSITFQFITTNAGKAKVEGLELEAEFAPIAAPGLRLSAYLNYNKGRYTEYIGPCYGGQSISAGCNTTFGTGFGQDLEGRPLAVAPDWTGSFGALYEANIGSGLVWEIATNLRYSDDFISSSFDAPLSAQDSYFNLDATLRLRAADNRWDVAIIARNVTNEFHISGETDLPNSGFGTGTDTALAADPVGLADLPRTVLLQYTQRF